MDDALRLPTCSIGRAMEILGERCYQEEPERFEYKLTAKGLDLYPAVVAIMRWGDEHLCDDKPPVVLRHVCGHHADPVLVCAHCREQLDPRDVTPEPARSLPATP